MSAPSAANQRRLRAIIGQGLLGIKIPRSLNLTRGTLISQLARNETLNEVINNTFGILQEISPPEDKTNTKDPGIDDLRYAIRNFKTQSDSNKGAVTALISALFNAPQIKKNSYLRAAESTIRQKFGLPPPAPTTSKKPQRGGEGYVGQPTPSDTNQRHETEKKGSALIPSNLSPEQSKGLLEPRTHPDALMSNEALPPTISIQDLSSDLSSAKPPSDMEIENMISARSTVEDATKMKTEPTSSNPSYKAPNPSSSLNGTVTPASSKAQTSSSSKVARYKENDAASQEQVAMSIASSGQNESTPDGQAQLNVTTYAQTQQGTGGKTAAGAEPGTITDKTQPALTIADTPASDSIYGNPDPSLKFQLRDTHTMVNGKLIPNDYLKAHEGEGEKPIGSFQMFFPDFSKTTFPKFTWIELLTIGAFAYGGSKAAEGVTATVQSAINAGKVVLGAIVGHQLEETVLETHIGPKVKEMFRQVFVAYDQGEEFEKWSSGADDSQEALNNLFEKIPEEQREGFIQKSTELFDDIMKNGGSNVPETTESSSSESTESSADSTSTAAAASTAAPAPASTASTAASVPQKTGERSAAAQSLKDQADKMSYGNPDSQRGWFGLFEEKGGRKKMTLQSQSSRSESEGGESGGGKKLQAFLSPDTRKKIGVSSPAFDTEEKLAKWEKQLEDAMLRNDQKAIDKLKKMVPTKYKSLLESDMARFERQGHASPTVPKVKTEPLASPEPATSAKKLRTEEPVSSTLPSNSDYLTAARFHSLEPNWAEPSKDYIVDKYGKRELRYRLNSKGAMIDWFTGKPVPNPQWIHLEHQQLREGITKGSIALALSSFPATTEELRENVDRLDNIAQPVKVKAEPKVKVEPAAGGGAAEGGAGGGIDPGGKGVVVKDEDVDEEGDAVMGAGAGPHLDVKHPGPPGAPGGGDAPGALGAGGAGGGAAQSLNLGGGVPFEWVNPIQGDTKGGRRHVEDPAEKANSYGGGPERFDPEESNGGGGTSENGYMPYLRASFAEGNADIVRDVNANPKLVAIDKLQWQCFHNNSYEANQEPDNPLYATLIIDEARRFYPPLDKEELFHDQSEAAMQEHYDKQVNQCFDIPEQVKDYGDCVLLDTRGGAPLEPLNADATESQFHDVYWNQNGLLPKDSPWQKFTQVEGSQLPDTMMQDSNSLVSWDWPIFGLQNGFIYNTLS